MNYQGTTTGLSWILNNKPVSSLIVYELIVKFFLPALTDYN